MLCGPSSSLEGVLIPTLGHCTQSNESMELVTFYVTPCKIQNRIVSSKILFLNFILKNSVQSHGIAFGELKL